jgi:hypothetical protein
MDKLRSDIRGLNHDQLVEIYNILRKTDSPFTKNSNGVFFNTADLSVATIDIIKDYVNRATEENNKFREQDVLISTMKRDYASATV